MNEDSDSYDWPVIESATEYETGWYDGGYDLVEQPDGSRKRYYWASLPPAAVVVPITGDEVVFVEQYRPTVRRSALELPAGIVDEHDGEPIERVDADAYEAAARRELREETGYVAGQVELLQSCAVATGLLRHRRGIVLARDLSAGESDLDPNEFLEVRRAPVDEALERAREPPVNDATLEGLLLAREEGYL